LRCIDNYDGLLKELNEKQNIIEILQEEIDKLKYGYSESASDSQPDGFVCSEDDVVDNRKNILEKMVKGMVYRVKGDTYENTLKKNRKVVLENMLQKMKHRMDDGQILDEFKINTDYFNEKSVAKDLFMKQE